MCVVGAEVYSALAERNAEGRPVKTLILSNSRVHPMDAGTFAAAEGTINTLIMANSSVNLDALRGLTNLKVIVLSRLLLNAIELELPRLTLYRSVSYLITKPGL